MRDYKPHTKHRKPRPELKDVPTGLVLTRELGEQILIGDNIIVSVVDISNGRVKLCVSAPREIAVDRKELRDRKNQV